MFTRFGPYPKSARLKFCKFNKATLAHARTMCAMALLCTCAGSVPRSRGRPAPTQ